MDYKINTLIHEYIYNDILSVANADLPWEKIKNKTILITGAGGFIGYYLTMAMLIRNDLYNDNITVLALVRNQEKTQKRFGDALQRRLQRLHTFLPRAYLYEDMRRLKQQ